MKRALQIALATALSLVFVWLSLRGTELNEVARTIARVDLRYVALYALVLTAVHVVRVRRWGLLLEPLARVRFRQLNPLGAVGFMALMVLPLRLGEFARPYLVAEHLKVRKSAAMASIVVERIVDGLAMGLLLVVLLWTLGPQHASGAELARVRGGAALVSLAFGGGLAALFVAFHQRERTMTIVRRGIGSLSPKLAERLAVMIEAFTDGLRVVPSTRKLVEFFGFTAAYWALNGLGLMLFAPAFGFTLTLQQAFTVLGLQVIGAMIPAGPGMVGTFQAFTVLGLRLFLHEPGSEVQAAAYAHVVWALQFAQQTLFGLVYVVTGRVRLGQVLTPWRAETPALDPSRVD